MGRYRYSEPLEITSGIYSCTSTVVTDDFDVKEFLSAIQDDIEAMRDREIIAGLYDHCAFYGNLFHY